MDWADALRVVIYVLAVVVLALLVRVLAIRGRWRHPFRGETPGYLALGLLLFTQARGRLIALNTGALPEVWPTGLVVAAFVLAIVWLSQRVEFVPPWRDRFAARRAARADSDQAKRS